MDAICDSNINKGDVISLVTKKNINQTDSQCNTPLILAAANESKGIQRCC